MGLIYYIIQSPHPGWPKTAVSSQPTCKPPLPLSTVISRKNAHSTSQNARHVSARHSSNVEENSAVPHRPNRKCLKHVSNQSSSRKIL